MIYFSINGIKLCLLKCLHILNIFLTLLSLLLFLTNEPKMRTFKVTSQPNPSFSYYD